MKVQGNGVRVGAKEGEVWVDYEGTQGYKRLWLLVR